MALGMTCGENVVCVGWGEKFSEVLMMGLTETAGRLSFSPNSDWPNTSPMPCRSEPSKTIRCKFRSHTAAFFENWIRTNVPQNGGSCVCLVRNDEVETVNVF